jgi:hypothetical protein
VGLAPSQPAVFYPIRQLKKGRDYNGPLHGIDVLEIASEGSNTKFRAKGF